MRVNIGMKKGDSTTIAVVVEVVVVVVVEVAAVVVVIVAVVVVVPTCNEKRLSIWYSSSHLFVLKYRFVGIAGR